MKNSEPLSDEHRQAVRELVDAFGHYAKKVQHRWKARIHIIALLESVDPVHSGRVRPARVRIDLPLDDAVLLAGLVRQAADLPEQQIQGPIGSWITAADAAEILGVQTGTIRGWIARRGPKKHRFPEPDLTHRGRNYWMRSTIETWKERREG